MLTPTHSGERASSGSGKSIVDFKSHLDATLSGEKPSDDTQGSTEPSVFMDGVCKLQQAGAREEPHTYTWATEITLWKAVEIGMQLF